MKTSSMCHLSPGRGRRRRRRSAKARGEFLAPASHRLVGDDDTAFCQDQLDIAQTEAEHVVQPDGVADDLGREPMAVVGVGWRRHATVSPTSGLLPGLITVTMPSGLASTANDYGRFLRMLLRGGTLDGQKDSESSNRGLHDRRPSRARHRPQQLLPAGAGLWIWIGLCCSGCGGRARPFRDRKATYFWSGVGGTYCWVDPALDFLSPRRRKRHRWINGFTTAL